MEPAHTESRDDSIPEDRATQTTPADATSPAEGAERTQGLRSMLARNSGRLRSLTERILGPRLCARVSVSDVVQSCFVDIMRSFHGFRDKEDDDQAFEAWSRRVVENGVRRKSRYYGAQKRAAEMESVSLEFDSADATPTPSHQAMNVENLERLKRAMDQLAPEQREVIQMHVIEGRPHDEISSKTGRSPEATRMLLSRARARLGVEIARLK